MKFGLIIFLFFLLFLACLPLGMAFAESGVLINEVAWMGTSVSSSDEWIELFNSNSSNVDLTGWNLSAADGSPSVNFTTEKCVSSCVISAGGFFLLERTDDTSVPEVSANYIYTGALVDTGEILILKDSVGTEIDKIDASFGWPAGDKITKQTMQKCGSGWITATGTPKAVNVSACSTLVEESEVGSVSSSSTSQTSSGSVAPPPPELQVKAYAGSDKMVVVGAAAEFRGRGYGFDGTLLQNPRYLWNFGDGETKDGQNVFHAYKYPGEYIAALDVSSGGYSNLDTLIVKAVPNEIFISEIKTGKDSFVELRNPSKEEINISGWQIKSGVDVFSFPQNSFIKPASFLVAPLSSKEIILPENKGSVELFYSGSYPADKFEYNGVLAEGQSYSRSSKPLAVLLGKETPGAENKSVYSVSSAGTGNGLSAVSSNQKESPALAEEKTGGEVQEEKISESEKDIASENNTVAAAVTKKPFLLYFSLAGGISVLAALGFLAVRRQSQP